MGVQTSSINNGPTGGFKNSIINGNFTFWSRGVTTTSSNNSYAADRWKLEVLGSSCNFSRQSFSLGQVDVPNNPEFWARCVVTSVTGSANYAATSQFIEGVGTFAGQQITISYWAKADSAKPISIQLVQNFGSGGSPSSSVSAFVVKQTLTTSWQKYSHTLTLPAINGKSLGTDPNSSNLQLKFWFDAGSNFDGSTSSLGQQSGTFDISQVQLENGPIATEFEQRPQGTELSLCQRYFTGNLLAGARNGVVNGSNTYAGSTASFAFPTTMRVTPTVTISTIEGSGFTVQQLNSSSMVCTANTGTFGNWFALFSLGAEF